MERETREQRPGSGATELGVVDGDQELVPVAAGPASQSAVTDNDVRLGLGQADGADGPEIACTLDGGAAAIQARMADWQEIVRRSADRRPIAGGVSLTFEHDQQLAVDLARLAAAEYACCSFFSFTLAFGPAGTTFTVTAPEEAGDVVTAMLGENGHFFMDEP
jgi:hypothetical protein